MHLSTIILSLFIFSALLAPAQQLIDLKDAQLDVGEFPYRLRTLVHEVDSLTCVGYAKVKQRNEWQPLYFDRGHGHELAELIHTVDNPASDALEYSIRENSFFLSQNSSILFPKECIHEINLDFITHDADADHLAYSYANSHHCGKDREHDIDLGLVADDLSTALIGFSDAIRAGTAMNIAWQAAYWSDSTTIRSAHDRPETKKEANGVYYSFNDFCEGELDHSYSPAMKKSINTHLIKIAFEDEHEPEDYYASQINGWTYLNTPSGALLIDEDKDILYSYWYVHESVAREPAETGDKMMISLLFGLTGYAIISIREGIPAREIRQLSLEMDPLTGNVSLAKSAPLDLIQKEILLYHSGFSRSDSLLITSPSGSFTLAQEQYGLLTIAPARYRNPIIISDGEYDLSISDYALDTRQDRHIIKRKKDDLSSQKMTLKIYQEMELEKVLIAY